MKFELDNYYFVILFLLVGLSFVYAPAYSVQYVAFLLIALVVRFALKEHEYYYIPAMFLLGTVTLAYFIRPFAFSYDIGFYMYEDNFPLKDMNIIGEGLTKVVAGSVAMLSGFYLFSVTKSKKKYFIDNTHGEYFWNYRNLIFLLLLVLLVIKIYLHLVAGVGLKGMKNTSSLAFLLRFIPRDLPFIIIAVYFLKYRKLLNYSSRIILLFLAGGFIFSVLITGSKTFVLIFALSYLTYLLYSRVKISLLLFSILSVLGILLLPVSFIISMAVKSSFITSGAGFFDTINFIFFVADKVDSISLINSVTQRMNGLDGQIVYELISNLSAQGKFAKLQNAFAPSEVFLKIIESMVPFVNISDTPSLGVAVGYYVQEFDPTTSSYAGALGFFASIELMAYGVDILFFIYLFFFGALVSLYFTAINLIKDPDLKFVLYFSGCYFIMHSLLSGNLDILISVFLIKIVMILFYAFCILIMKSIVKPR